MDVFRFVKLPRVANDLTRRYRLFRGGEREPVGEVEVGGYAPECEAITLTVTCDPLLSDAAREDALNTARRFLDELAAGWGRLLAEVRNGRDWTEQPDGRFHIRLDYQVVCENI